MNTISLALADVEYAFRHLEFAIKLMCHCELDHLDRATFDTDVSIQFETENIGYSSGTFETLKSVIAPAQAIVGVCFGVSALVLEAAFEAAAIRRLPESRAPVDELRTLVYMVRCAFAHNPAFPRWEARGREFARVLSVPIEGTEIAIDLSALHGQPFDYEHIGGFGNWQRIRFASEAAIRGANPAFNPDGPRPPG